jgi:7-cyano-7-deazaguanine synthase
MNGLNLIKKQYTILFFNYKEIEFMNDIYFPDVTKVAVSLSGGLDSTTLLYMLVDKYGKDNVFALSFFYQQKQNIELELAKKSCEKLAVNHQIIDLSFVGELNKKTSANIIGTDIEMPTILEVLGDPTPSTYVSFRNQLFTTILLSYAETNDCGAVALGLNSNDQYNYWDTTPEFVERMQALADLNRTGRIELFTPLVNLNKTEEIKIGMDLGVDYSLTMTCYNPEAGHSCGKCASCAERVAGFKNNGLVDPIQYSIDINWG